MHDLSSVPRASSKAEFREFNQHRGIPLTPAPLPRWGEGANDNDLTASEHCIHVTPICILNWRRNSGAPFHSHNVYPGCERL